MSSRVVFILSLGCALAFSRAGPLVGGGLDEVRERISRLDSGGAPERPEKVWNGGRSTPVQQRTSPAARRRIYTRGRAQPLRRLLGKFEELYLLPEFEGPDLSTAGASEACDDQRMGEDAEDFGAAAWASLRSLKLAAADFQFVGTVPDAQAAAGWRAEVVPVIEGAFLMEHGATHFYNVVTLVLPTLLRYVAEPLRLAP